MRKQERISNGIKTVSSANDVGKTGQQHAEKMNLDHFLKPYTKINSNWMKDLNVRQEAIKILEEKAGKNLFDLGHSNFLLNTSLEARETKAEMNYWDLIKIKTFCTAKETISKTKRQLIECEKIFANDISGKGLVSKSTKNLSNSIAKKQSSEEMGKRHE